MRSWINFLGWYLGGLHSAPRVSQQGKSVCSSRVGWPCPDSEQYLWRRLLFRSGSSRVLDPGGTADISGEVKTRCSAILLKTITYDGPLIIRTSSTDPFVPGCKYHTLPSQPNRLELVRGLPRTLRDHSASLPCN